MTETRRRILLVEDDRPFARTLEKRLTVEGYDVACADDGREGMRSIVTFEPELVISDWLMPHVDGLELCQSVKTGLGDDAPYFILLTAMDDIRGRITALETGADDYLVKPCHPAELSLRVRRGLRERTLRAEVKRLRLELDALRERLDLSPDAPPVTRRMSLCRPCAKLQIADGVWEDLAHCVEDLGLIEFVDDTCPDCAAQAAENGHGGRGRTA